MSYRYLLGAASLALVSTNVYAQDGQNAEGEETILVTASRSGEGVAQSSYNGSVTVLDAADFEARQARDLADILRDVPGVAVAGTPGLVQLRLRGSEGNHVLFLVDGIEVASAFYGEADAGTFQADIGGRAEVLRGPQSALYGPDAIGGVIAYQSASGRELSGLQAYVEGGSFGTINGSARGGFANENFDIAMSINAVSTDGTPNARGGTRDIGRDSTTFATKLNWQWAEGLTARFVGRYIRTQGDFNNQDFSSTSPTLGFVIDSPGVTYENEATYLLAGLNFSALDGRWTHDLSGQFGDVRRDTFANSARDSGNVGQRYKASYVTSLAIPGGPLDHQITLAADFEREEFRNTDPSGFAFAEERGVDNTGLVAEYRLAGGGFDLSAAVRHDINDLFADDTTFRVAGGVSVTDSTRVRAAFSSGSKNPGFYELYGFVDGRFIGNPDLEPEKSTGWEVGIDQSFADGAVALSLTYFDSELEGEIFTSFPAPTFVATPANRTTVSTQQGIEFAAAIAIGPQFSLDAAYTYLDAEENGAVEVRRPEHTASAAMTWTAPKDAASATLVVRYNGEAIDSAFTDPSFIPIATTLDDFTLVNLNARVKLTDAIELFGRVENLLDEEYEQVFSFVSQGRSVIGGVRVQL